jgi:hypothetical protein
MQPDYETSPALRSAIQRAYHLVLAGESLESIASTWNAARLPPSQGLPGPAGRPGEWSADAVRAVLTDPRYAGPAAREPLVGEGVWRAAMDLLSRPSPPGATELDAALLTAIAVCAVCERPVRSELVSAGQVAYRCDGDAGDSHLARTAALVDSWIRLLTVERLSRPDAPGLVADEDRSDLYALRAHSAGLRTRRMQLDDAAAEGQVDQPMAAAGAERLDTELAAVEDQMIDHSRRDLPASLTGADPLDTAWDRLARSRQRGILLALAEQIALHPVPEGRRAGDPDVLRSTVVVNWRAL